MSNTNHKVLIIGKEGDTITNLIKNNITGTIVDNRDPDESINIIVNDPDFYDLIIITTQVKDSEKIKFIHSVQSCSDLKYLTIIVEVNDLGTEELDEYIKAGARYCFNMNDPKFALLIIGRSLIEANQFKTIPHDINLMKNIDKAIFTFKTLDEAKAIGNFIANACPNPKLAIMGIIELLVNAVEHGNLAISYDEKSKIFQRNIWEDYINKKLSLPENSNKHVTIEYKKTDKEISLRIEDQGNGFDWKKFKCLNRDRILDNHGRGIFLASSLAFNALEYEGKGNIVNAIIYRGQM